MKYLVVEIDDRGAEAELYDLRPLLDRVESDWTLMTTSQIAGDRKLIQVIRNAEIGTAISWRMGWIFVMHSEADFKRVGGS